jgi:hypothetical protein
VNIFEIKMRVGFKKKGLNQKFSHNKIDFRLESLENQETYRSYIQLEEYCFGVCRNDNDCLAFSLDNSADLLNCIFIKHSENLNSE